MLVLSSVTFLSVILFFIALSLLVVIHELGHFSMAKLFNVYCFEFSVGFGPALFQRKKAGKETTFSIRAIPLGGYVSMYGESETLPEDLDVPPERSLLSIKKWKRAIIMAAGIVLNFVLGFVLFAANTVFFPQIVLNNRVSVTEFVNEDENIYYEAYQAGLRTGDTITKVGKQYYIDGVTSTLEEYEISTYDDLWNDALLQTDENLPSSLSDKLYLTLYWHPTSEGDNETIKTHTFILSSIIASETDSNVTYSWSKMGISTFLEDTQKLNFKEALRQAGSDWWESATLIAKSIGNLFIGRGYDQVGGPVAILTGSSNVLEQLGFGYYLNLWGSISVNLGLFNLLPFPGLDGWHLLVVAIEGIFHKEIPSKIKNTISTIGMLLLFGLMILVFIKDIFGLFSFAVL